MAIGGRNKYLINGHLAQQNRVQNLFHSVQLNINNPHFLIMQGRITKVINMSPMELLGLIAEAAGTKMYEAKKDAALKTIEKKQAKVEEIHKVFWPTKVIPSFKTFFVNILLCHRFYPRTSLRNWRSFEKKGHSTCNGPREIVSASGCSVSVQLGNSVKPRYIW